MTTNAFIEGLRDATAPQQFQLTTDGFSPYIPAIDATLEDRVDYGMLVKQYAENRSEEKRYSPAECTGCQRRPIIGNPDRSKICTSHIERQNLTMRMQIRRLTREVGELVGRALLALRLLQPMPHSRQPEGYSGDGV